MWDRPARQARRAFGRLSQSLRALYAVALRHRRVLWLLLVLVVVAIATRAAWTYQDHRVARLREKIGPTKQDPNLIRLEIDLLQIEFAGRAGIINALLGLSLMAGLYFTWRNLHVATETLQTTQKGQVTERFTRAIDQIGATHANGDPNLEVRLGGIHALDWVARDSAEYKRPVAEILVAYVRMNGRRFGDTRGPTGSRTQDEVGPGPEVQAILTLLGKAALDGLNLRATNLRRADLRDANLRGADLRDADLTEAHLDNAQLQSADLRHAVLPTNLRNVQLQEARLDDTNLDERDLSKANLRGANLETASLRKAIFERADLRDAKLGAESHLDGARFEWADLR